jgi:transcriptional regulator with XRE-family HTH domain
MLSSYLREKLGKEGASVRQAARDIGVSHTTILRVLDDQPIDVGTLIKVCDYVGVAPAYVLNSLSGDKSISLRNKMDLIVQRYPRVQAVFDEAIRRLENGEVSQQAVDELLSFAAYRLGIVVDDDPE